MYNRKKICWCEKCCLQRASDRPTRRKVTFWGDSPNLLDPPPKSTAYFYKRDSPYKLTVVNLN